MKHTIIRSVISLCRLTRAYRLLCPFFKGSGIILAMHRVVPDTGRPRILANSRIEVTPQFLESLILFFREKGYEIISLDEMHARVTANRKGPPFVCFTFDDGYADIYDNVFPVFIRHNIPFAVYVVTSFADRAAVLWWYMLEDIILASSDKVELHLNNKDYLLKTATHEEKETAYNHVRDMLMSLPQDKLPDAVESLFSPLGIKAQDYGKAQMDWEQVAELARHPLATVGAHTVHHFNLKQLSPDQVRSEIKNSKRLIEERTGVPVHHFAYPFGSKAECGRREFDTARDCGFKTAVTVREGAIFPEHRDYMECLPRIEITGRHQDLTLVDMRRCGLISILRNGLRRVVTD